MSTIQSAIHDAFIEAGASEPKARTAAEAVAQKPHGDEVTARPVLERLETQLKAEMAGVVVGPSKAF